MDHLGGIAAFVQAAEARSFVAAGRMLGVSASAIGKSIARLESRVGVRLFHRSTRSIALTAEGALFLESCRRILLEIEQAEQALSSTRMAPRGRLKISLPLVGGLLNPVLVAFARRYPDIELDIDCTDRRVDLIEEGFDAVVRVGETADSRLMSRKLGTFHLQLVASPDYLRRHGWPLLPADLARQRCLLYKFPSTGKIEPWPVGGWEQLVGAGLPTVLECSTIDTLMYFAEQGMGIACLPDFAVGAALADGRLHAVLAEHTRHNGVFQVLWPSSKHLSPKLRALIDFLSSEVFANAGATTKDHVAP
ncbi:LysR family transcriptional regulator [Massilia sp. CCM 8733]|uniref:LysR family transcriptional regulator n=1 Tax=Massilia mucilaginosa TaxID=2609282 RepID=A0ABX0NNF2_9BURK|nr:LysR family transcriptional regulator [Massilia mucilaginosa]NHZ88368.1 LysR family transcriptional regulator [Massilia mucilaginosa]